jgi:hypothetical protein
MAMTAFLLVGLLGLMAIGVNFGIVLLKKRELANAADAAALAGVQELPESTWNARARAYEYGIRNKLVPSDMTIDVSLATAEVSVTARHDVSLFFAPVLGFNTVPLSVKAKARVGPVVGVGGAVPLSVEEMDFQFGQQYMLKDAAQEIDSSVEQSGAYRGNFGPLSLGVSGANAYKDNFKYGYNKILRVGDVVQTETGNMAGPTAEAIAWRTQSSEALNCTFENANKSCPQYVIVPVISEYAKGGRGPVTITGFAAFFLEGTTREGSVSYVVGRFLQRTVDGEVGNSTSDYGLRAYRLVE